MFFFKKHYHLDQGVIDRIHLSMYSVVSEEKYGSRGAVNTD